MALSAKEKRRKQVLSLEFPLEWKRVQQTYGASCHRALTRFGRVRIHYRRVYRLWEAELPGELAGPNKLSPGSDTLSRLKDRVVHRMVTFMTVNPVTTRDWLLSLPLERGRRYVCHRDLADALESNYWGATISDPQGDDRRSTYDHLRVLLAVEEMVLAASEAGPDHNATLASLGQAALANPRDLPILADWLEEHGHTLPSSGNLALAQAAGVRELASVIRATQVEKLAAAARLA